MDLGTWPRSTRRPQSFRMALGRTAIAVLLLVSPWVPSFAAEPDPPDDPSRLAQGTFIGSTDREYPHAIAIDAAGNILVAGYTISANFPTTPGAYDRTRAGDYDVFVAKFDSTLGTLLWSTLLGGAAEDRAFAIALDAEENVVVAGLTYSADFPTTPSAFDRSLGGARDGFVAKLSADGSVLRWSTLIGGTGLDRVWDLALGAGGQPIVVGETSSGDFPTAPSALQPQAQGSTDGFVFRLNAQGQGMISGSYLGGALADQITALEQDAEGNLWVTGNTDSQNLPVSPDAYMSTRAGGTDAFVHRLDGLATQLLHGTYLGGAAEDRGNALTIDQMGRVLVAGSTLSADFPTLSGSYDLTANGGRDAFVTGFAPSQATPVLSSFLGGLSTDEPFAITVDSEGRILVAGETSSADFPTTADALDRIYGGNIDAWVTRFDSGVSQVSWSSFMGGSLADGIWEITVDDADNPVCSGPSRSPEMPTTSGAYDPTHNGTQDVHVSRLALGVPAAVGAVSPLAGWLASPNPARGPVTLRFHLEHPVSGRLWVYDAAGRRLGQLGGSKWTVGVHRVVWDATSGQGRPAPTGVYWFRFDGDAAAAGGKIVLLR